MKKIIAIEGMHCSHCKAAVERALNGIEGVSASVSLEKRRAEVSLSSDISDETLKRAVQEAGFSVGAISAKKSLFGKG